MIEITGKQMACLGEIDCGASQARAELLFLVSLLVELGDCIEPQTDITGALGFSDVYRCPAMGADDFINLAKPSVGLHETLAALRTRALKLVAQFSKVARTHGDSPIEANELATF